LKKRMVKVLVWPIVLYKCDTWTLLAADIAYWKYWKYGYGENWKGYVQQKIQSEVVWKMVGEFKCLIRTICKRKNWIGCFEKGWMVEDVLKGSMLGQKPQGKPNTKIIDDLMTCL
jgi:hypothetical protein